ncbi:PTS lactose/cellobiose transporter subunit IIA [Lacrimispora sp.]|uniref:PTS lactose/cellobiose transporter subunit IIA n=1 Tax=Lacrimispora sp. TaxID=2719234 RepID=UPI0028A976B8|nr:PTS lactose/cellobiose transporter subunit IIA [Lacrimispora sp.]
MDEKTLESAMSIIMNAGDARLLCKEALTAIADQDFILANEKMKDAQKKITEAHRIQTDAIQEETRGEKTEYSLIFAHAQDTLMTIYSEINIAKQMIKIFESWEKRLKRLEIQE